MDYEDLIRIKTTQPAPERSSIVLADVKGSTEAVRAGRYREVNLVGAACIAAIRNNFATKVVPYVFGGDGATFLVEESDLEKCLQLLHGVQAMALQNLGLILMVGHIPLSEIRRRGSDIHFGFLSWSDTEALPFFRGDGIALAERLIKENFSQAPQAPGPALGEEIPTIEGLSCRLEPFAAIRGRVLSILIEPTVALVAEDAVFKQIFAVFKEKGTIDRFSPLTLQNVKRSWIPGGWRKEARLNQAQPGLMGLLRSYWQTLISSLLVTALFRFKHHTEALGDPELYTKAMLYQSDWIKMDGILRLVIDVNADEERELRQILETLEAEGKLLYGIHISKAALMTCHFQAGRGQKHVHFIDGSDGGLTLAAYELKGKKRALVTQAEFPVQKAGA